MANVIYHFVKGSAEPLQVQLHPSTDTTGAAGIDLTGSSSLTAKAKHTQSGALVTLTVAIVEAISGKVQLSWGANDFNTGGAGVYDVQISFNQAGSARKYPSNGTGLRIHCHEAN